MARGHSGLQSTETLQDSHGATITRCSTARSFRMIESIAIMTFAQTFTISSPDTSIALLICYPIITSGWLSAGSASANALNPAPVHTGPSTRGTSIAVITRNTSDATVMPVSAHPVREATLATAIQGVCCVRVCTILKKLTFISSSLSPGLIHTDSVAMGVIFTCVAVVSVLLIALTAMGYFLIRKNTRPQREPRAMPPKRGVLSA